MWEEIKYIRCFLEDSEIERPFKDSLDALIKLDAINCEILKDHPITQQLVRMFLYSSASRSLSVPSQYYPGYAYRRDCENIEQYSVIIETEEIIFKSILKNGD